MRTAGLFKPSVPYMKTVNLTVSLWDEIGDEARKRLMDRNEFVAQALKYALERLPERFNDEGANTETIALPGDLDSDFVFKDYDEALAEYNAIINTGKENAIKD